MLLKRSVFWDPDAMDKLETADRWVFFSRLSAVKLEMDSVIFYAFSFAIDLI